MNKFNLGDKLYTLEADAVIVEWEVQSIFIDKGCVMYKCTAAGRHDRAIPQIFTYNSVKAIKKYLRERIKFWNQNGIK